MWTPLWVLISLGVGGVEFPLLVIAELEKIIHPLAAIIVLLRHIKRAVGRRHRLHIALEDSSGKTESPERKLSSGH